MTDSNPKPTAIFLMGPTAAGKTGLAMRLADHMQAGLISVDSGQVYRGLDIGTAKITADEMREYPHALIDIKNPDESYSADEFSSDALSLMDEYHQLGKTPLLVGGTMFYFRALQYGLPRLPAANDELRKSLMDEADENGWESLHARLAEVDPTSAKRININDRQRIQRALEIYELSGITATQHAVNNKYELPWNVVKIGIWPENRSLLHKNIELRLEQMFQQGFLDEVVALQAMQLDSTLPAMRAVGYRQVLSYLQGEYDYDEMRRRCLYSTRQLAKRQLTWLRNDDQVVWFNSENKDYQQKVLEFVQKKASV
jgi:tRNA dimethylallyltransferase